MEWKAALADGMQVGTAFLSPLAALRAARAAERLLRRRGAPPGARTLERDLACGLLCHAAGRNVTEIASDVGAARSTVHGAMRRHRAWMTSVPRYEDAVALALASAVRRALPPRRDALELRPRVGS